MSVGGLLVAAPRIPAVEHLAERHFLLSALLDPPRHVRSGLNFEVALALAERNAISSAIAENLASLPQIPAYFLDQIGERRCEALLRNQMLLHDARRIAAVLRAQNLAHLFLKGTALQLLYPSLAARHTDDIDLLIAAPELKNVQAALASAGFVEEKTRNKPDHRHPLVMISEAGTKCEVHTRLDAGLDGQTWARAQVIDRDGTPLRIPHEEDLIAHLCHHVLVQHASAPRYLPRHLVDMAAVLSQRGDLPSHIAGAKESQQMIELIRASLKADRRGRPTLLASMLFPTHHSVVHRAIATRLKRAARGLGGELQLLAKLPSHLFFRAD